MIRTFLFIFSAMLFVACSSDKDEDVANEQVSLIGSWNFTELDVTGVDDSNNLDLADDVIRFLIAQGCDIVVFDFNTDQTVDASVRDFTETGRDIGPDGASLLIECPENVTTQSSIWRLEGDQLTFITEDLTEETITIELTANTLTIPGEFINADNLSGTNAIFTRQ